MIAKRIQTVALIALAIGCSCVRANPDGPTVVNGSASFSQPNANTLNVTTSTNKAIINWQGFDIGPGQTTNIMQPNRNSAVLNRVLSNSPSQIYGNLNSNGKVFVINQHGLMIGAGASINTAGFYGSTLNITNEDFLKGNLKFAGGGIGGIVNRGYIHAGPGGNVVLIAPDIENGGVIEVDNGKVILAAGESIRITSLNDSLIEFDVTSNDDNSIINLGDIVAKQGAVQLFAGSLKHSGSINATGLVQNADGSISLVAQADIEVTAGASLNADGDTGGNITVQSDHGDVYFEGSASAQGTTDKGGHIEILGDRVGLFGAASVDASGQTGGGEVLVGGDFQGKGDTKTASQTQVGPQASIHADAIDSGDGGKVIVWADDYTLFQGAATATAGAESGDGGFIEISGKGNLGYYGSIDASASNGAAGTVLFDPIDVIVELAGLTTLPANPLTFLTNPGQLLSIAPIAITAITDSGSNVIIQADRDITITDAITTAAGGAGGDLTFEAGQSILINANITTDNGTLKLYANSLGADLTNRGSGVAQITQQIATNIDAGTGNVEFWMNSGVGGTAGNIDIADVKANHVLIKHNGLDNGGSILQSGGGTITASSVFIDHDGPFNGTVGSPDPALNLVTDNLGAHIHEPTILGIYINAQPLNTSIVTVGNTCYGNGDPGCATFGSHLVRGLETINGGGSINLDVSGSNLLVVEPIQVDDVFGTGNPGNIFINSAGPIIANNDIINFIPGGNIDLTFSSAVAVFNAASVGINGGTITLDNGGGAGSGPLALNSGTFLEGVGVIDGDVFSQGGVIDIGDDQGNVGTLTISGNLALDTRSIVVFDIVGSAVAGTDYDQLVVNGASGAQVFGDLAALWDTLTPPAPATYTLIDAPNGLSGAFSTVLGPVGSTFTPVYNPTNFQLSISAVAPVVFWTGQGDGVSWEVGGNWSTGTVPNNEFVDISFDGPIQVTISSAVNSILGISTQNELSIQGSGQLSVTDPATSLIGDLLSIDSSSGLSLDGDVYLAGLMSWKNGTLGGNGVMTIASIGGLELNNPGGNVAIKLINKGTISKIDAGVATLVGTIDNFGAILVNNGTLAYQGALNEGTIDVAAGAILTTANADLNNLPGATIGGSGTIDVGSGTLFNDGTLEPGGVDAIGILTILGNLILSSSADLQIEVDNTGLVPGNDYDQLVVSGAGSLGTLDGGVFVSTLNGDPVVGTYTLVDTANGATLTSSFGFPSLATGFTPLITDSASVQTNFGSSVFWVDNGAAGDWFDVLNWSTTQVPLITQDVTIAGLDTTINIAGAAAANSLSLASGYTLNINSGGLDIASSSTVAGNVALNGGSLDTSGNLQLDGTLVVAAGTLTGIGNITVNGGFLWTGGSITGSGLLTTNSTSNLNQPGGLTLGRNWVNAGTMSWEAGNLSLNNSASLTNTNSFAANAGATMTLNSGSVFDNQALLTVNSNTSISSGGAFTNSGSINVVASTLSIGTSTGTDTGDWSIDSTGAVSISGGTRTLSGSFGVGGSLGALNINGGALNINTAATLTLPVGLNLNVSAGTLTGNQALTVDGTFLWTGGSINGTGLLTTTNTSILNQGGGLTLGRNWVNAGTIDWQAGNFSLNNSASLTNTNSFAANAGATMTLNSGSIFDNQALLTVNSNTSISSGGTFTNSGSIDVVASTLSIGTTAGIDIGSWTIDSTGAVSIIGGTRTLSSTFSVASSGGALNVSGGTLNVNTAAALTLPVGLNVNESGGTLTGTQALIIDGPFLWAGGGITGTGLLTTNGTSTLNQGGGLTLGRNWVNAGTIDWQAGNFSLNLSASLTNTNSFAANAGATMTLNSGSIFDNQALLTVNSNTSISSGGTFTNSGSLNVVASTLSIGTTAGIDTGTWAIDSTGAVSIIGGTRTLSSTFSVASSGGALNVSGGTLNVNTAAALTLPVGLNVNVSAGSLTGSQALVIDGAFLWSGGAISGTGLLTTNGSSALNQGGGLTLGRNWVNAGTINWQAGNFSLNNSASLTNTNSFAANAGATMTLNSGSTFDNQALLTVNSNTSISSGGTFTNSGSINVVASTLSIGTTAGIDTGTWAIDSTGAVSISGGTRTLSSNFSVGSSVGALNVNGGTLDINTAAPLTLPAGFNVNASAGVLTGAQALIIDGALIWTGSSITGAGLLTTNGASTFNQTGGLTISRDWLNNGNVNWQAGNTVLNSARTFTNAGIFDANSGATFTISSGGATFDNQGVFNLLSNISINNGSNFVQSAGQLNLNDFVLTIAAGLQLNGGNLSGSGSIVGNVINNGATLQPGGAAAIGTINITGNLINTSGVIEIEIQSVATPGVTYDLIAVSGQTDLNDTLTLLSFGGYTVTNNDSVTPITSATSINNFSVINPLGIETVIPTYNATGLDLLFTLGGVIAWDDEAADGNWFSATNWVGDVLPTISDDVAIGVFNVTIAGAADVNTLTLSSGGSLTLSSGALTIANNSTLTGDLIVAGGTLNLTSALTVNGNLNWTSVANSTIDGATTGSLIINGALNISGNNFHSFSAITVNNFGVTSYLATGGTTALRLNDGTTFNNNGLFDIQDNLLVGNISGVAAFNNQAGGELRKSGGTAAATIVAGVAYSNSSASISIQSGSLTVNGGAALTLDSTSVLQGSGTYIGDLVNNGTIRPGGALTTGTLSVNGVFTNTGTIEIEIDNIAGGPGSGYDELAIIGGNPANLGGNLNLISINGYSVLNGDALTPVSYGSSSGNFTFTAIGTEIISPTYNAGSLDLVLNFGGLFSFTGGGDGSTWNDAANWNQGVPGIVNDVSIGSFNVTIAADANANALSLAPAGSLNLSGGTLTIAGNSSLDGPVTMSGGDLDIGGVTLTLNGGFNWTGPGFIYGGGSGILNLLGANIIAGAGSQGVDAVTVNISGNTTYSAGSLEFYNGGGDPIINNSGIFDFAGDVSILDVTDAGLPGFNNLNGGTIVKSAGTGTSTIGFMPGNSNQGSVIVQSGTLDPGLATWTLGAGDVFSGSGTYVGDVINNGGIVRPGGAGSIGVLAITGNYTQNGGLLEAEVQSGGTVAGIDFDQLSISGTGSWTSTAAPLNIAFINAYLPTVGDVHTLVTCADCGIGIDMGPVTNPSGVTYGFLNNGTSLNATINSVSFFWDGGGDGINWTDQLNWSLDLLPNSGTDVLLTSGQIVTFADPLGLALPIANLTLNSGSSLNLASGTLTNIGTVNVNAGASLGISGGNLVNNGIATFNGNFGHSNGNAAFNAAAVFNAGYSQSGGTETFADTADFNGSMAHSGGVATFNGLANMPGSVNISGGALVLNAGATLQNLNNTWSGGTISGGSGQSLVLGVSPGDTTLAIVGGATKTLDTITLYMNLNDINMSGNGNLLLANNAIIDNTGGRSFNHSGNGSIAGLGSFVNNGGTFNKGAGAATLSVDLINDPASVVNVAGGTLIIDDAETNNDSASYNVGSSGVLIFAKDRILGGNLNLDGSVVAGLGATPTTLTLPTSLNNKGALLLNNAVLDLVNVAGNTLVMNNGTLLGGRGTVQGNVNNVAGVVAVGGNGNLGNLVITGTYTQGANSAVVVEVLNNGVNTVSDLLTVNGPSQLNGGTLLIGFVTTSLGLVTADFKPFDFSGGVSGKFTRVFDAGGNVLLINFNGGVFTILGASPKIPDRVIDDLIGFLEGKKELKDTIAGNLSAAEAIMEELLDEGESGSLVCN